MLVDNTQRDTDRVTKEHERIRREREAARAERDTVERERDPALDEHAGLEKHLRAVTEELARARDGAWCERARGDGARGDGGGIDGSSTRPSRAP